jgi:glycosyltransferase involved in cell wall biosynthesis
MARAWPDLADAASAAPPVRPVKHLGLAGPARRAPRERSALIVSSFVLPHPGGVEQFVDTASTVLKARGWSVRVLACRQPEGPAAADVTMPARFLPPGGWPVPVRGWHSLWREIGQADVVIANGTRNVLPNIAAFVARLRGRRVLFVLHGSGAPFSTSSFFYHRVLGSAFEWLAARPALRLSMPISLSRAGVEGARRRYGIEAAYVPYPLRDLPPATPRSLEPDEPIRIVWVGRLYPEKAPLQAVAVVERVRRHREATLDVYGSGVLLDDLALLARDRPWLVLGGTRSWRQIQAAQSAAHVCLSTSFRDATQIAILEPLARGIPVVSTRVGDAPAHYASSALRALCVAPDDPEAAASAILELASSYQRYREQFAANGRSLRARHRSGPERLSRLLETAASSIGTGAAFRRSSRAPSGRE